MSLLLWLMLFVSYLEHLPYFEVIKYFPMLFCKCFLVLPSTGHEVRGSLPRG